MVQAETRQAERPDDARRTRLDGGRAGRRPGGLRGAVARLRGRDRADRRRQGVPADRVDDVVQDTLLTIHRARQTYDPTRSFTAWLAVLAERRAVDLLRKTGRHAVREVHEPIAYERHADESAAVPGPKIEPEVSQRLGEAVADLPLRQREAVQMLVLQERSLAETAATTGRSNGSLKVNLHRALKSLRARLGPVG